MGMIRGEISFKKRNSPNRINGASLPPKDEKIYTAEELLELLDEKTPQTALQHPTKRK